jgi:hypothetical protein
MKQTSMLLMFWAIVLIGCGTGAVLPPKENAVIYREFARQVQCRLNGSVVDAKASVKPDEVVELEIECLAHDKFAERLMTFVGDRKSEVKGATSKPGQLEMFAALVTAGAHGKDELAGSTPPLRATLSADQKVLTFRGRLKIPSKKGVYDLRLNVFDSSAMATNSPIEVKTVLSVHLHAE